jgi:hypothetical protein
MIRLACTLALLVSFGCDGPAPPDDAASCGLDVTLGVDRGAGFEPLSDGDSVELLLGFQGFRMLRFAVRAAGAPATEAEVGAFLSIRDSGVELSQRTRERALVPETDGFVLGEYLLFVNDHPPALVVGHEAELELTVTAGGCVGGRRTTVIVRDDDPCVDHGIVLDAATRPDAPDGGMACDGF